MGLKDVTPTPNQKRVAERGWGEEAGGVIFGRPVLEGASMVEKHEHFCTNKYFSIFTKDVLR